jgi:hypothetical protein
MKQIFSSDFRKSSNIKFQENLSSGSRDQWGKTERQKDRKAGRQAGSQLDGRTDMTKLLVAIDNFVNSPQKDLIIERKAHLPIALDLFCIIILLV